MTAAALSAVPARVRAVPPASRRPGLPETLRSEFTKIRSVRSTYWTLLAQAVASTAWAVLFCAGTVSHGHGPDFNAAQASLTGQVALGELIIVVLGALVITSEYSTGMIRTSLAVMPRRGVLYAAKAIVFAAVTLTVSLVTSFADFFVGQALAEMSSLLGVLRTGPEVAPLEPPLAPAPAAGEIALLVTQAREAGMRVSHTVEGPVRPLPGGLSLAAYRIVQEALTNVRKHAGPEAAAEVTLRYGQDELLIRDVIVMDVRMPGLDGIAATREICQAAERPRVLILTTFDLDEYAFAALRAGASGFLLKSAPPEELLYAIRCVHDGDSVVAPSTTRRLIGRFLPHLPVTGSPPPGLDELTAREREVLAQVGSRPAGNRQPSPPDAARPRGHRDGVRLSRPRLGEGVAGDPHPWQHVVPRIQAIAQGPDHLRIGDIGSRDGDRCSDH
jgi:DNA-binding NarL/FixJ family response regulator